MQKQDMRQKMVMILKRRIQPMMYGNGMKKVERRQVAQEQYMAFMTCQEEHGKDQRQLLIMVMIVEILILMEKQ